MPSTTAPHSLEPLQDAEGVECRVWERQPCDVPASCQPVAAYTDKDSTWTGSLRDVSSGGVGLVLERRFEPGTMLFIKLPGPGGTDRRPLLARVVYAKRLSGRSWLLGCTFPSRLSGDEVRGLLALSKQGQDETPQEAVSAGRLAARGGVRDQRTVIANVTLERNQGNRQVVRCKPRRLVSTGVWPPQVGTVLQVRTGDQPADPAISRLRVIRCNAQGNGWLVQYEFAGQPSQEALGLLGQRKYG